MVKKYYYIPAVLLVCLLFTFTKVEAAETWSSTTNGIARITTPTTITLPAENQDLEEQNNETTIYNYNFPSNVNVYFDDSQGKYIYGYLQFRYTVRTTVPTGFTHKAGTIVGGSYVTDSLRIYVTGISTTAAGTYDIRIHYIFDGYYCQTDMITSPAFAINNIVLTWSDQNAGSLSQTLSLAGSVTVNNNSLVAYDAPQAFVGQTFLIGTGVDSSSAVASLVGLLQDIKTQDLSYYNQLTSQLSVVLQNQVNTYNELIAIFNEIDTDFSAVQTILDLFPSYRTAVLQYWQDLLQMNATQSSAAADIESQYAQNDNYSGQLIQGLDSITYPTIPQNGFDILGQVDTTQKTNFFGLLSIITNNSYITTILLIICTGALVGFILYGKKG